jgi:hypothetical protein
MGIFLSSNCFANDFTEENELRSRVITSALPDWIPSSRRLSINFLPAFSFLQPKFYTWNGLVKAQRVRDLSLESNKLLILPIMTCMSRIINCFTISAPIPLAPPVTTAVLPFLLGRAEISHR